jgi:hypothetical protein
MKKTGIILIVVGLLFTVFTGFGFFTKEKVVDIGRLEITKSQPHRVNWSPYVGVGIMIVGGIILIAGARKSG